MNPSPAVPRRNSTGLRSDSTRKTSMTSQVTIQRRHKVSLTSIPETCTDTFTDQGYRLPVEILAIVAEYLVLNSAHKTCAALNQTCHAVQQETTATLWRTISAWNPPRYAHTDSVEDEMQMQEIGERWEELIAAPGTKYTEYVHSSPCRAVLMPQQVPPHSTIRTEPNIQRILATRRLSLLPQRLHHLPAPQGLRLL
jgi:hypothetical protein